LHASPTHPPSEIQIGTLDERLSRKVVFPAPARSPKPAAQKPAIQLHERQLPIVAANRLLDGAKRFCIAAARRRARVVYREVEFVIVI
jgi:hypothetical protein